jgi:hypothetical protein
LQSNLNKPLDSINYSSALGIPLMIENEKPVYESYRSKKKFFLKHFKLSRSTYELNASQSNNENYHNPNSVKVNLEFKDVNGAKKDDAFKIELNESIFIRQVKIDFYVDMVNRIKELNIEIDEELNALSN